MLNVLKHMADDAGIEIVRKNGKSTIIARVEAVNLCRKLWQNLGLNRSTGIQPSPMQYGVADREKFYRLKREITEREELYRSLVEILCGDDIPEFEVLT
jgi:hypothetical protein